MSDIISFGPFRLAVGERLLTRDGVPVEIGTRTLDTLIALISRPNEVVSKDDLMAQVWGSVNVEDGSLRFQIAGLRKALGDGKDGARYITTLTGRGYCFVAPVSRATLDAAEAAAFIPPGHTFLPPRLARIVGRGRDVHALSTELTTSRFVTIAGPGGVGKTTVAVTVAHDLLESFDGAVLFVDLAALTDPNMVATSVASMLGLSVQSHDPTPGLIAHLRDRKILVILDNCEHVIDAAATLASLIFLAAPQAHILATSREALRVEGEQVYRLTTLAVPPEDLTPTADLVMTFSAAQLFVERAVASGARLTLDETNAAIVAHICRKLDGVALAIELAAGRVEAYGLEQTATLLDERLSLLWLGPRTAPPRQKTLQATLDWSCELLSETERAVLRRLAVFVGHFTLDAALEVVPCEKIDQPGVVGAFESLVAKSMIATRPVGVTMRYRLLDTTRAYALAMITDDAEIAELSARHATYYLSWLEEIVADRPKMSNTVVRLPHLAGLNNVRAALEWSLGPKGNPRIGIELAAAAAPVFLAMSLLTECARWSERAILSVSVDTRGGPEEMHLQAALGLSLMYTSGNREPARLALTRSLAIAEERGDLLNQLRLLGQLYSFHLRVGDFNSSLDYARRGSSVSRSIADPAATALGHSLMGTALHFGGELSGARVELEAALRHGADALRVNPTFPGFDLHSWVDWATATLARTLWLVGQPTEATDLAHLTVNDMARRNHPVRLSVALTWAISVFLWTGDLASAEQHIEWLISQAETHSMGPYLAVGHGYQGELAIRQGSVESGVERLQGCLRELRAMSYNVLTTPFKIALAKGLAEIGKHDEAAALINEAMARVETKGDLLYMPELLRVKASLLLAMPRAPEREAETILVQSLEWSRRQGARAWELRTAVDLASLWAAQGRTARARDLLKPVFDQFGSGAETADLKASRALLATLD